MKRFNTSVCVLLAFVSIGSAHAVFAGEISEHSREYYAANTESHVYTNGLGQTMPYRLFVPPDCDSGKEYPLLLSFHGAGSRGNDNLKHLRSYVAGWMDAAVQEKHPCMILMPQCPEGQQWVDTSWKKGSYSYSEVPISTPMTLAKEILDKILDEKPVDPNRIYVMGASMGGYGTWYFTMRYPELVAAAVPVCGGGDPSKAESLKNIPIWAFHGDQDPTVPPAGSLDMVNAIEQAGGRNIRLTLYEGVKHDSFKKAWREPELAGWVFAKRKTDAETGTSATFFTKPDFKGESVALPPGEYNTAKMTEYGIPDDTIASLKVGDGFQVVAYEHDHFQGNSRVFTYGYNGSAPSLYTNNFDASPIIRLSDLIKENMRVDDDLTDRISSLRIFKPVIEDADVRDNRAEQQALDGWWTASMKDRDERLQWWREAKFGAFIHWGASSVLGGMWEGKNTGTYSEHIQRQVMLPLNVYKEVAVWKFNPVEFDADEWVRLLKETGMKYLIITAKHHDGFAVYRSDAYYYDMDLTPFGRDPMLELREACTKYGLKFGFYYSQAFDWEHPDGAGNDWEYSNPGGDLGFFGGKRWHQKYPELVPRVARYYVDGKAIPQLLELIRKYRPDILWGDTDNKLPLSEKLRMLKAVREADPDIVINGRFCRGGKTKNFGDYVNTGDRPAEVRGAEGDWEAIPTTNESYGFKKDDRSHKPLSYFIRLLAKVAARGGNTLMNVGPRPDGTIDAPDVAILKGIGQWMKINGESIHGTQRTPLEVQPWGQSTRKGNILYLHVFEWPADGNLVVGGLKSDVDKAWLLADAGRQPLETARLNANDLVVTVSGQAPDPINSVIVLESAGPVVTAPGRLLSAKRDNVLHVFDAQCSSSLGFGDGKVTRDYVRGWTRPTEKVWWPIRANEAESYRLTLKYTTEDQQVEGNRYRITVGDQTFEKTVEPSSDPVTVDFGSVEIPAGNSDLMIEPVEIKSGELMKLYQVVLEPI